jgi:hypothetical protein
MIDLASWWGHLGRLGWVVIRHPWQAMNRYRGTQPEFNSRAHGAFDLARLCDVLAAVINRAAFTGL